MIQMMPLNGLAEQLELEVVRFDLSKSVGRCVTHAHRLSSRSSLENCIEYKLKEK